MSTSTILIVDDEPQIRRVMRTTLSSNGYAVIEARSGEEALEILRKERPELVLLDVNMPGMGGLEVCRQIRDQSDVARSVAKPDQLLAEQHDPDGLGVRPWHLFCDAPAVRAKPGLPGHLGSRLT